MVRWEGGRQYKQNHYSFLFFLLIISAFGKQCLEAAFSMFFQMTKLLLGCDLVNAAK